MKNFTNEKISENFKNFTLTNDEMFCVRGGEGEGTPTVLPNPPKPVI